MSRYTNKITSIQQLYDELCQRRMNIIVYLPPYQAYEQIILAIHDIAKHPDVNWDTHTVPELPGELKQVRNEIYRMSNNFNFPEQRLKIYRKLLQRIVVD